MEKSSRKCNFAGMNKLVDQYRNGERDFLGPKGARGIVRKKVVSELPKDPREVKLAKLKPVNLSEEPEGVKLRGFSDFKGLRQDIYDGVLDQVKESFPVSYGGVRLELDDLAYADDEDFSLSAQKAAILQDKFMGRRLRGTFRLYDDKTDEQLDESTLTLMKVPHLTDRGTFIHGGNEYVSMMQSRLIPGAYSRRQANGELETQFNVRSGTGAAFRVAMNPKDAQFRMRIKQSNLHLYSLLHDLGVPDETLKDTWGEEVLAVNKAKYDRRVFDKAYQRLLPAYAQEAGIDHEGKKKAIIEALERSKVNKNVLQRNLPNLFERRKAAEWKAQWMGKKAAMVQDAGIDSFSRPELQTLATFLNQEHQAGIDIHLANAHLRQAIVDAILKLSDINPNLLAAADMLENSKVASAIDGLLQAKEESDNERYMEKTRILMQLMNENPDDFLVDDRSGKYWGITHVPTGFQIHVDRSAVPAAVGAKTASDGGDGGGGTGGSESGGTLGSGNATEENFYDDLNFRREQLRGGKTKKCVKKDEDGKCVKYASLQDVIDQAELVGSRGRARHYGREEPEGRDYDYAKFTDDPEESENFRALLERLIEEEGFQRKDWDDGSLTAFDDTHDISLHPSSKKEKMMKVWELIEGGMDKNEAWDKVNQEAEDTYLYSAVPGAALESVLEKGLMSSKAILDDEEALKLLLDR
jgi:hypothetical protein